MHAAAAAAKLLQSCPTLCDPIDSSPPDSLIPGILQARTLEWVAISFSIKSEYPSSKKSSFRNLSYDVSVVVFQLLSHVWLFATPWTATCQASLSFTISQSLFILMSIESVMQQFYKYLWSGTICNHEKLKIVQMTLEESWLNTL